MRYLRKLPGGNVLIEMTAEEWRNLRRSPSSSTPLSGTVRDWYGSLPAGAIPSRIWLALQRAGIDRQPVAWLQSQLSSVITVADGRSLAWLIALKRRQDPRVPEIVYCRLLGEKSLRHMLQVLYPILEADDGPVT